MLLCLPYTYWCIVFEHVQLIEAAHGIAIVSVGGTVYM